MTAAATLTDVLGGNAPWMIGNLLLAWAGVWFAWQLIGSRVRARRVSWVLAGAVFAGVLARADARPDGWIDPRALLGALVVTGLTLVVMWRARSRDRWAMGLVLAGAITFAPNAPYVLTDGMHYVQDLRRVQLGLADGAILAIAYGWFLAIGLAAWIILVDIARAWIPARQHAAALAGASVLAALAIYVGRIERIHSWHLLTRPREAFHAFAVIVTDLGPALFVVVWTSVVAVVSVVGTWSLGRARRHDPPRRPVRLVAGWAWFLAGALLAGLPLVGLLDPEFGLDTARAARGDEAMALVAGVSLAAYGLRLLDVLRTGRAAQTLVAAVPIVLIGWLLVSGSTLGWWAQYRGLCEYGPGTFVHRETCR